MSEIDRKWVIFLVPFFVVDVGRRVLLYFETETKMNLFFSLLDRSMEGDCAVNWQERCVELETSLQRFRDQAGKIRGLLRDKVSNDLDILHAAPSSTLLYRFLPIFLDFVAIVGYLVLLGCSFLRYKVTQ